MTNTPKAQKDKPYAAPPRLTPRPTAASAARAARNATNRNLLLPQAQRQSPTRTSPPVAVKVKSTVSRNLPKCGSKSDIKVPVSEGQEIYVVEKLSVVTVEETPVKHINNDQNEIDSFEVKSNEDAIREVENEGEDRVPEQLPPSGLHTPVTSSRPQTPKSHQSSRPQTPRQSSRPTTPVPRNTTPVSQPTTPQRLSTPTTPIKTVQAIIEKSTPDSSSPNSQKDDEDVKTIYTWKQKEFQRMKKELDMKQQAVLEAFNSLGGLRERMSQEGSGCGEGLQQQELVMFNVADWTADEVSQLCRDAAAAAGTEGAAELISTFMPIDECVLADTDSKVLAVPTRFADLCLQAFTARQELVDWVKNLIEKQPDIESNSMERVSQYNTQGLELCERLRELKSCAESIVDTSTQLSRRMCHERNALYTVGQSLVRGNARLQEEVESKTFAIEELRQAPSDDETSRLLEETRRELEEERTARIETKEKLSGTETQLRQTRLRVSKMDRQLREAEASIASLTGTVKTLEDQSRQREVQLEARARKLKESLKTGEVASGHIAQQRDALLTEIAELKEKIQTLTSQHKSMIQDSTSQLKELKTLLEEQKRTTQEEIEEKHALHKSLTESQYIIEELKAKIGELENMIPNPDLPTEREMDLWAELQATKDTLRMTEDEVTACKREKVRFLETMTKITETDNKMAMQQKLATELVSKEEILGKMQIQMRELTKNIKLNEQKVAQYEQYVQDLQAHNRAVGICQEAPNGISYQDLQQEIMNLRMSLLQADHRNEELTEILGQKEQQMEQQDKTSRAQARVIKVREELINMLKNKETEQSRELTTLQQDLEHRMNIVGDVNKQIAAKAEEIQELFVTLENKQQQIHRLEKIVLALEEQQRRAQAQRTRHEEKIAALEHELAAGGNRRERKFLFF